MKKVVRQGDMIFYAVNNVSSDLKKQSGEKLTVGFGEVTGHSHDIFPVGDATIEAYVSNDAETVTEEDLGNMDKLFFEITNGSAVVVHEEHDTIELKEGKYLRINQVEYNPFTDELQKVAD